MSKKYLKRALVWSLLIIALSVVTYYNRELFIKPLKEQIVQLKQEEQRTQQNVKLIQSTIDKYNNLTYDNNTIKEKLPAYTGDDEEIQQKYIIRPVKVSGAELLNLSLTSNTMPSNLKLSKDIDAEKVSVTIQIDTIDQFYTYINELTTGMRCIYIGGFNYSLPGEKSTGSNPIQITLDYYVFYTKDDTKN